LADHKRAMIVLVGAISLLLRAALLPVFPVPHPAIQDEFSYLLAADTFAHGRLANPTPSFAAHFETLQVLMHPTYASKYPPASGLVMGLAQKLTGEPWLGIWFATGVLCSVICWALQGWLPAAWALIGSLIALLKIGILSYWSESYWGGTCTAIGGALLVGAIPRLLRRPGANNALCFAAGLAILANTRPFEGLMLAAPCTLYVACALLRRRLAVQTLARTVLIPACALLAPVTAWMSYYNYHVTGNAWELPYVAHDRQYAIWSPLLWQTHPSPRPVYSNAVLEDFWTKGDAHDKVDAREHILKTHVLDLFRLARFYLGLPLALCAVAFSKSLWRDAAARGASLLGAAFYAGAAFDLRLFPHYAAPATVLAYIIAACAIRAVRSSWPGRAEERLVLPWAVLAVCSLITVANLPSPDNRYLFGPIDYHVRGEWASVIDRLERIPGHHLVLVSYGPKHEIYQELVYNRADIDRQRVIWARSLSPELDRKLIEHYPMRQVWTLREDGEVILKSYRLDQEKRTMTTQLAVPQNGHF